MATAVAPAQSDPPVAGEAADATTEPESSPELADSTSPEPSKATSGEPTPEAPELSKEEAIEEALNCPCISKMKEGSCGEQFVAAYRCFLESEEEPKGAGCIDLFTSMQNCMVEHADEYNFDEEEDGDSAATSGQETSNAPSGESSTENDSEVKARPPEAGEDTETPAQTPHTGRGSEVVIAPASVVAEVAAKESSAQM